MEEKKSSAPQDSAWRLAAVGIGSVLAVYGIYRYLQKSPTARSSMRQTAREPVVAATAQIERSSNASGNEMVGPISQSPSSLAKAHAVFEKLPRDFQEQYACAGWLGSGLTSSVILVRSLRGGCVAQEEAVLYALKVVSKAGFPADSDDQHLLELVRQETRILCELQHPNVIKVKQWTETKEFILIAMEHIGGGELYDNIVAHHASDQAGYTEDTVRRMFRQMLEAIQYCHERGVIHRDIKPENILLSCGDLHTTRIKLCDFGLAKLFQNALERLSGPSASQQDGLAPPPPPPPVSSRGSSLELRRAQTQCGSEHYHAPEISRGSYDAQCDLYSLGVVLYVMLSGELPDEESILEASGISDPTCVHFRQWCVGEQEHPVPDHHKSPGLAGISGSSLHRQDSLRSTASSHSTMSAVNFSPEALFRDPLWRMVSVPAKDLIARLLRVDPHWRINATQALAHPWLVANSWQELLQGSDQVRHSRVLRGGAPSTSSPLSTPPGSPQVGGASSRHVPGEFSLGAGQGVKTPAERSLSQLPAPPQLNLQGSGLEVLAKRGGGVAAGGAGGGFSSDEDN